VLHYLDLTPTDASTGEVLHRFSQRFGFVEWAEAAASWTVNGVRINFISDATPESGMSDYDCYTTSEAFGTVAGARETWRRYMRLGISSNRIHQVCMMYDVLNI
jgi:hypothetical protein